jgi:hypothetical protein
VRRLIPASVAAFACLVAVVFCAALAEAQVHGWSTSAAAGSGVHSGQPRAARANGNQKPPSSGAPHAHRHPFPVGGVFYAVPYPVYMTDPGGDGSGAYAATEQPQPDAGNYGPGPTIFDNNGSGNNASDNNGPAQPNAASQAGYAHRMNATQQAESTPQPADPDLVADQPQTVLVFKDGHLLEVQNYAIVGDMLYDVTPGHHSKIALADLDLTATAKENDDRGIDFQLPNRLATN